MAQAMQDFFTLRIVEVFAKFFEREVNDVVVMDFFGRDFVADLQPQAVQQIDFLGSEVRRVRAKIEDVFLAAGEINFQSELRLGIGEPLPGESGYVGFFGDGASGRNAEDNG